MYICSRLSIVRSAIPVITFILYHTKEVTNSIDEVRGTAVYYALLNEYAISS